MKKCIQVAFLLPPRPNIGLIAFLLQFWLHPSLSSGVSYSGSFDTFYPIPPASEITPCSVLTHLIQFHPLLKLPHVQFWHILSNWMSFCSAYSPSCTCGSSGRSCGSSRPCLPSSVASGWFFILHHQIAIWICFWFVFVFVFTQSKQNKYWEGNAV